MSRRKGFTLLELLVIIVIIGLLAGIGMVQYARAVANAKNAQAKQVLGAMRKASMAYHAAYGSWPPASADPVVINVDLDGDSVFDITYTTPTGNNVAHIYSTDGTGFGYALAK